MLGYTSAAFSQVEPQAPNRLTYNKTFACKQLIVRGGNHGQEAPHHHHHDRKHL
jgi:hypothetical protein